ncbi:MAG: FumA C-terminus/TtdB family hydratase beta subunit [Fervidobacterium sp.]|jgi:fumarate hydratase subunit beta
MVNIKNVKKGDVIYYTGKMIVMRDAAQKRLVELEVQDRSLPINLSGEIVFYAGPTFVGDRIVIGPTTSKRMDRFLEFLGSHGVIATVGKGERTQEGLRVMNKYKMVYFVTPSGCAAYLGEKISRWSVLAFDDLGPEAIYEIYVENFPLLVRNIPE